MDSFEKILTIAIYGTHIISYFTVAIRDPGIATTHVVEFEEPVDFFAARYFYLLISRDNFCEVCQIIRWDDVTHCDDCGTCMIGLDHHCPWTTKCVAKNNITVFFVFVCSTVFFLIYAFCVLLYHTEDKVKGHHHLV